MTSSVIPYREDINGMRAVAVLAVVVFHAWPSALPGGFVGVDVFFVISGYLISLVIFTAQAQGRFSLYEFYSHRVRRIFPALAVVLLSLLVVGWFVLLADEYKLLGRHTAAGALFLANFAFWREAGYFDIQSELKPLLHLWSLGIEEQYYLIWPLFLMFLWKRKSLMLIMMVVSALVSFGGNLWLVQGHVSAVFYFPFTRAWELIVGGILAWAVYSGKWPRDRSDGSGPLHLVSLIGILLLAASIVLIDQAQSFPGWRAAVPVLGTVLLLAAGPTAIVNRYVLSNRLMVAIGLISYPLYLWHWPLLSGARILDARAPSAALAAGAVHVALVLATLTYLLIEKPVRRMPACVYVPLLGGAMATMAIAGVVIVAQDGFPGRMQGYQEKVAQIRWALEADPACKTAIAVQSRYCRITDPTHAPTAAVVGDSHANRLFEGLGPRFAQYQGNLLQLGEGGCLPFWNLEGGAMGAEDTCSKRINAQLDFLLADPDIRTVVLTGRGPLYISGVGFGEVEKNTRTFLRASEASGDLSYHQLYLEAMRNTVSRFLKSGKKVVFVIDNPELGFDPLSCVKLRPVQLLAKLRDPCAVPRPLVDARNQEYMSIVRQVSMEFPEMIVIDPKRVLCDAEYCWAMKNKELLYMDGDHLNRAGARLVAKNMPALVFQ
jgi:peptidoglycan/LPS O-acetylase OafA/YrhL